MHKYNKNFRVLAGIAFTSVVVILTATLFEQFPVAYGQSSNADDLVYKELIAVYETNLIRRENGLAPLRWNRELSQAARDFARDTIVVRNEPYCGHTDSMGRSSGDRIEANGYRLIRWAENAACGYLEPDVVVPSWFESESHRRNMLIPDLREMGVGYYVEAETGRGYVVQDFAFDGIGAPLIINNEAPSTESTEVSLYIYDNVPRTGFNAIGPAVEMMISNSPYFENTQWEPYRAGKDWFLDAGTGWRTVHIKTRDRIGRIAMTYDTIYLGKDIPTNQLSLEHASTIKSTLTGDALLTEFPQAQSWSSIQVGRDWVIDDSSESFSLFNNSGSQINDSDARGGTAYQLTLSRFDASYLGDNATSAAAWVSDAIPNTPLFAYLRVKVARNRTTDRLLKIWAESEDKKFEPIILKENDFASAGQYQEIAVPLEFVDPDQGDLLALHVYHYGGTHVSIDTVSFFTAEQLFDQSFQWSSSDPLQRDRGFMLRVMNDANDSGSLLEVGQRPVTLDAEANLPAPQATVEIATPTPVSTPVPGQAGIILSTNDIQIDGEVGDSRPDLITIDVECTGCEEHAWWVYSSSTWLQAFRFFNDLHIQVDQSGLTPGIYEGLATVGAPSASGIPIQQIMVRFEVTDPTAGQVPVSTSVPPTATPAPPQATPTTIVAAPPTAMPTLVVNPPRAVSTPLPTATPTSGTSAAELTRLVFLPFTSR